MLSFLETIFSTMFLCGMLTAVFETIKMAFEPVSPAPVAPSETTDQTL
jgi:hypothetical protein